MIEKRFRFNLDRRLKLEAWLVMPFYGIFENLPMAKKLPKIADMLGCSITTVKREVINRGFSYDNYNAYQAQNDSDRKVSAGNTHYLYSEEQRVLLLSEFKIFAQNKDWSPKAFLLRLKLELDKSVTIPCLELLYQWVYEDARLGGELYKLLPRGQKRRKKQKSNSQNKINNKVSIHERDAVVSSRTRLGDFEIDSVVSAGNKAGITTANDRTSRFCLAKHAKSKHGDATKDTILVMLRPHMRKLKTITSDNGTEFAEHLAIAKHLKVNYYFADPYCSNQRGGNENINGMIRRYFPKGTEFTNVTEKELQDVIDTINHLPRKIHNGKTAHEIYYGVNKTLVKAKHRRVLNLAFRS